MLTNFQIETGTAKKVRSLMRTALFMLRSVQTPRFEIFNRAGELLHPQGQAVLRGSDIGCVKQLFLEIAGRIPRAA